MTEEPKVNLSLPDEGESPHIPPGVWPTMITPFTGCGDIDWPALDDQVEWYIDAGVAGLFAVCLSSEMYELSPTERVRLAEGVVERAAGRVPVVAAGAFGDTADEQADAVRRVHETGVEAVVLTVNQLAGEAESDDVWQRQADAMFGACEEIPLGLYECPRPYHRTLSAEILGWAARTGRIFFYKDTCCDLEEIRAKLTAIEGTSLSWFNAHAPTLLESLRAGGRGYSSIAANFIPETYVWLCHHFADDPDLAEEVQAFLTEAQKAITVKYPAGAKHYLRRVGLDIEAHCRVDCPELNEDEVEALEALRREGAGWMEKLGGPERQTRRKD